MHASTRRDFCLSGGLLVGFLATAFVHSPASGSTQPNGRFHDIIQSQTAKDVTTECPCHDQGHHDFNCTLRTTRELSCSFHSSCTNNCTGRHCRVHFDVMLTNASGYSAQIINSSCVIWKAPSKPVCEVESNNGVLQGQHMCICKGDNCSRVVYLRVPAQPTTHATTRHEAGSGGLTTTVISVVVVSCIIVIVAVTLVMFLLHRHKKLFAANHVKVSLSHLNDTTAPSGNLLVFGNVQPVTMEQVIVRGRFGVVWQGHCNGEQVAVKIFSEKDRDSWANECRLYSESYMQHPAILRFWYGEERRNDMVATLPEFWLVTSFCEMGNLTNFLRRSVLSWEELGLLAESLIVGVAYLHEDVLGLKPAIAHRDLKSANILLRPGPRCVIADFGLAVELVRSMNRKLMEESGQAGTPRYMAPECLEARINLSDPASFLQMDVYSMSLVLWEICSRCSDLHAGPPPPYLLPYQVEVSENRFPSVICMREVVAQKRYRPTIPSLWSSSKEGTLLVRTIRESWEHHPEARLTSANIVERVKRIWRRGQLISSLSSICTGDKPGERVMPEHLLVGKRIDEGSSAELADLDSPESTLATDLESRHNPKQLPTSDSGCVSGGITTDPENSTSWHDCPPRAFRNSYSQPMHTNRVCSGKGNESSASSSSDIMMKARYMHTPRVCSGSHMGFEGSSAFETSGGYEGQKSSSESSSSDAALPSNWQFPKSIPMKFPRPRSVDLKRFSGLHSETSI